MSHKRRDFIYATAAVTAIVVGTAAFRSYREVLPPLFVAMMERLSDAFPTCTSNGRPTPAIERLRGDEAGEQHVTAATVQLADGKSWSLQAKEMPALVAIVQHLEVLERPEGAVCVLLAPFRDALTITTSDSSLPIRIRVTADRGLIQDEMSYQPYVVVRQSALTALMAHKPE
jgi:hypothetical protein